MNPKFSVGDVVYYADAGIEKKWITCPDCMGKKYLTVILGDGTTVTIDCVTCSAGWEPPTGIVYTYEYSGGVKRSIVGGMEIKGDKIEYLLDVCGDINGCCSYRREKEVFASPDEAKEKVAELVARHEKEERERLARKEKPARKWAWNATYHRNQIKQLTKEIEYHTAKMNAAKQHSKDGQGKVSP